MLNKKGHRSKHFRNEPFLKALGQHCKKIRIQKGLSIDRLSRESDQLSPSVIHRLETGSGAVTVSVLLRYSQALGVFLKDLVDIHFDQLSEEAILNSNHNKILVPSDYRIKKNAFIKYWPIYHFNSLMNHKGPIEELFPRGWIEIKETKGLNAKTFITQAIGDSMLPKIKKDDFLVFKPNDKPISQGQIVLAQYKGPIDPESGGHCTVKLYYSSQVASEKGSFIRKQVTLSPTNPEFESIVLFPKKENEFRILGELLYKL